MQNGVTKTKERPSDYTKQKSLIHSKDLTNAYAVEVLMNFPFLDIIGQCSSLKPTEAVNEL